MTSLLASMIVMGLPVGLILVTLLGLVYKLRWLHTHEYLVIHADNKYAGPGNVIVFSMCYCGAYKITPMYPEYPDLTKTDAKHDH